MQFDDLLVQLGEFGTYQKRLYMLVSLPKILVGFQMVISVFITGVPFHRCSLPSWNNDTYAIQGVRHGLYVNITIPYTTDGDGTPKYSRCERYDVDVDAAPADVDVQNHTREQCSDWVYDTSIFQTTAVRQMDLVCDKKAYRSHAQMVFMGGVLLGSIVFGVLADILGRKTCICVSLTLQVISGMATAFAPEFYTFVLFRMFNGASNAGLMLNSFVLVTEFVGPSKRRWTGILIMFFFTFGYIILAGLAYLIRDWQYLHIACSAPGGIFLIYWCILPESPRWLLAKGRKKEAKDILRRMAKVNKADVSDKMLDEVSLGKDPPKVSLMQIFSSKVLVLRAAVSFFNWMVVSMVYYGLSLNSGNLVGSLYLNFLLTGLVELPAYVFLLVGLQRVGRRSLHSSMMIVGGLACVATLFPVLFADKSMQGITVALAMVGKLCATSAFATVYVVTSEVFPTVIRNGAMGAGSMCARVGGMMAPYIADMGDYIGGDLGQAIPLIIFGGSAVIAGFLSLLLPETFNRKLPETIEDGINFTRNAPKSKIENGEIKSASKFTYFNPSIVIEDDRM